MSNQPTFRQCRKCGSERLLQEFQIVDRVKGWRRHECRHCYRYRMNAHYLANKEHRKQCAKANYASRPSSAWTKERRERANANAKRYREEHRRTVIDHYGGQCSCCGEDNPGFLTIDHKNNDGAAFRRQQGVSLRFYRWIIKNGFPDDLQLLCYNCNCGRHRNGGVCPHEIKEGSTTSRKTYPASDWQGKRPALAQVR